LRPRIWEITTVLLDDLADRTEVDLLEAFAYPLPITVMGELFGVPETEWEEFRSATYGVYSVNGPEITQSAAATLAHHLTALIDARRAEPSDDLLSALVAARDANDQLSEAELVSMAFLLLSAGFETTVNLIGNGMLALLRNPDQLALLLADRSLLPNAIEELLRYEGPIDAATLRFTTDPVEIGGVTIPEGEFVLAAVSSANRDGESYPKPDRLDVTRDAGGHLAFGHGAHYCLGAPLARIEARIAFDGLLDRFPDIHLAAPADQLRWREFNSAAQFRSLERLPVLLS
jgi:cytochrome P450